MTDKLLWAFLVGGTLCAVAQILIDRTAITPAKIMVIYVVTGAALTFAGLYEPIVKFAGAGASVPLTGFGYALAKGVEEGVAQQGALGILTGGITGTAGGIAAAILLALLCALFTRSRDKS